MARQFWLKRVVDETGISGTGIVCEGIEFGDGRCVMRWIGEIDSIVIHKSIQDIEKIHGHSGSTMIVWFLE